MLNSSLSMCHRLSASVISVNNQSRTPSQVDFPSRQCSPWVHGFILSLLVCSRAAEVIETQTAKRLRHCEFRTHFGFSSHCFYFSYPKHLHSVFRCFPVPAAVFPSCWSIYGANTGLNVKKKKVTFLRIYPKTGSTPVYM